MLSNEMSWVELGNKVADEIEKNSPKKWNREHFLNWFAERESVGHRFDYKLVYRAYKICQQLHNQSDHFTVIVGAEGSGKTTLGIQLACWTSPNFKLDSVCYNSHDYLKLLQELADEHSPENKKEKKTILLDEAALDLFSREAMNLSNRWLSKAFFCQRFLNAHIILCIPNFFMLDTVVREHRVRSLISVLSRGRYRAITGTGINKINQDGNKYHKNLNSIPIADGHFWLGYFNKPFPATIDQVEYEKHKLEHIKNFLDTAQQESIGIKMVSVTKVSKELGCVSETLINQIKKGELEGKQIGKLYYVTKAQYDKLMTV